MTAAARANQKDEATLNLGWCRAAFENAPVGLLLIDRNWKLVEVNEEIAKMLGYSVDDLRQKSLAEIMSPEDFSKSSEKMKKLFAGSSKRFKMDVCFHTKTGDRVCCLTAGTTLGQNNEGGLERIFLVLADVTTRRRLEVALKESESNYHTLVEISPYPIAVHANGKIIYVNPATLQALGATSSKQLIGKQITSFLHPDSLKVVKERVDKMQSGGEKAPAIHEKFVRLDGETIDVEAVAMPIMYEGQKAIEVIFHDISETKSALESLRKSEELYRALAEAANDMIYVLDKEGRVVYNNSYAAGKFGVKPEELIGRKMMDLFPPEVARRQFRYVQKVFGTGKPLYVEEMTHFGDTQLWIGTWLVPLKSNGGGVDRVMGVSRDISDQMKMEDDLKHAKEYADQLIDGLPGMYFLMDQDGKFWRWNHNFLAIGGYTIEEVNQMVPTDFFVETDREIIAEKIKEAFANGYAETEATLKTKDGRIVPILLTGARIDVQDKMMISGVGVDISERKKMENDLVVAKKALEKELQTVEEFTMVASHEMRAPMTAMKWQVSAMLDGTYGAVGEQLKEPLAGVLSSTTRLINLINDMISLSRLETGTITLNISEVDLAGLLKELLVSFSSEAKKKEIDLTFEVVTEKKAHADSDKVVQILSNLIDNAIKYTPEGGKINVTVKDEGSQIVVYVTDSGMGIREESKNKLFKKFATVHEDSHLKGTGLGLFISRKLAQEMGGDTVLVSSQEGKGSTFAMKLPAV